jgi:lipid-A-disaccharide synthase-like uncharacterized protein
MKWGRLIFRVFLGLVLLFLLLLMFDARGFLLLAFTLLGGWMKFLLRVLPQVTISWSGIGMVVVCSALVLAAMHWLCQWLYAHWVRHDSATADVRWRWSWTASLYGGVWLLFLAAMGVTGVVHQAGWLAATKEPFYVEREWRASWRMYLYNYSRSMHSSGRSEDWSPAETRREFEALYPAHGRPPPPLETLHVIYFEGSSNKLAAAILFYRDPKKRDMTGFMLVTPEKGEEEFKMDQLPTVLARYQHGSHPATP